MGTILTDTMENLTTSNYSFDTGLFTVEVIVGIIVLLFGVPGNCLILCVYWTKTLKTSTNVFIMALAWTDLSVCCLGIISYAFYLGSVRVPIVNVFEKAFVALSIMLTIAIAVDRFDCICRQQRRFLTHKRGKIVVLCAVLISLSIALPHFIALFSASSDPVVYIIRYALQLVGFFDRTCDDRRLLWKSLPDHSGTC